MAKSNKFFDFFLTSNMGCLRHSEKVECWGQKMVVLADDYFFVRCAFNHCQMVLSSQKLCLLFLFSPISEIIKKPFCSFCKIKKA